MNKNFRFAIIAITALALVSLVVIGAFFTPQLKSLGVDLLGLLALFPLLGVTSTQNRFQDLPCSVVVSNNYDTHGTITRTSVANLTPAQLEAIYRPSGLFADMDSWFKTAFEMKACGIKQNGLYDWLMSSARSVGQLLSTEKLDRGPSLLKPFILGRQDSVINKETWALTAGWAVSGYNLGVAGPLISDDLNGAAQTDRVIRVVNRYGLDLDAKWFLDRDRVSIFGRSGGQATDGQWRVLGSHAATDMSYIDVVMTSENSGSTTYFDAAPTSGLLLAGANNVNDFESWCSNRPTLDPRKRVPFWYQTMRRVRTVDSEYKKVFAQLMESNEYFRTFGDLPLAERNRQDEEEFQRRWLNSFFFGKAISANQTLANWQNLEPIQTVTSTGVDPGFGGKTVAYRANMIGIKEQLQACGRVKDLQNNPLNLYEFLSENYRIWRARRSQGRVVESLDWYTDSLSAANDETAFIQYYKAEYGDILRVNIDEGSNELGFHWRSFKVKYPIGIMINLVTHEFFDDFQNAAAAENIGSSGRFLWCLDIGKPGPKGGTIYPGVIASNRKMRTLGELEGLARIDPTFACTMENITEEISLTSETMTAICECPADSLMIQGIADGVPITTGQTANPTYDNLY